MGCNSTTILTESTNVYDTHNTSSSILNILNVLKEYEDTTLMESKDTFEKGSIYFYKAIEYNKHELIDVSIIYFKRAAMCYHEGAFYELIKMYRENDMMRKCAIYSSISKLLA